MFLWCVLVKDTGGGSLVTVSGGFVKKLLLGLKGRENDTLRPGSAPDGSRLVDFGCCPDRVVLLARDCGRELGAWSFAKGKLLSWWIGPKRERVSGPTVLERRRPLLELWFGMDENPCVAVDEGAIVAGADTFGVDCTS